MPMASWIVTTVAKPSGMVATARLIAIINVFITLGRVKSFVIKILKAKINAHIPMTAKLRILLN